MVSVIIPTINDPHLNRTIKNVRANSDLPVEFIVINDTGTKLKGLKSPDVTVINNGLTIGKRASVNNAVKISKGNYIFILDSHCSMSKGWTSRMVESCVGNNLVYAIIRDMDSVTWEHRPGNYIHVRLNKEYTEKWWNRKPFEKCEIEEESMTITGCAWMVTKKCYNELGGYDESLGEYGWEGPEWTCKVWMGENPGRVICRTDVVCGHIFGTNVDNKLYRPNMIPKAQYLKYMREHYDDKIEKLVKYFAPVPDWEPGLKGCEMGQTTKRTIKVERTEKHVTKNVKGVVIKKVIEHFEYIYTDSGKGPSETEIAKKYGPLAKKVREEVWELKNGKLKKVA